MYIVSLLLYCIALSIVIDKLGNGDSSKCKFSALSFIEENKTKIQYIETDNKNGVKWLRAITNAIVKLEYQ